MSKLNQNFDLLAIVVLAAFFGLADLPGLHRRFARVGQEHFQRDARILRLDRFDRLNRVDRVKRIDRLSRLIYKVPLGR